MIITKYICDKCGKETLWDDIYSVMIKRGIDSAGGGGGNCYSSLNCVPITYNTKHICASCLQEMFSDNSAISIT